jgi:hypothetical protein
MIFGGMAEWFKAAVLKTVERKLRGFESYSLRHVEDVDENTWVIRFYHPRV